MSKKTMLLALALVSAAMCALPAVAAAQEIHLEPAEKFTITGPGGETRAEGEPSVTCEQTAGEGSFDAGSSTTGSMIRDYTGCHVTILGFTVTCHSEGSAVNNTVLTKGTFHLITLTGGGSPAILMTTEPTSLVCAGISTVTFTGAVIGTIVSPRCGESSKTLGVSFTATGVTQSHLTYTGLKYDLLLRTGTEATQTAVLVGSTTATSINAKKLNCT